eukprot:c21767_g2_i2.p1 GENE.c21767_g2_i2~~c21767_g2_i2.p1  ORF type:complete len:191 (+),score=60.26 c21767_g2_i2:79-573(+)
MKLQILHESSKFMQTLNRQLEEIETEAERNQTILNQIESTRGQITTANNLHRDLANEQHALQRQINSMQEKSVRLQRQHNSKVEKSNEDLKAVQDEIVEILRQRDSNQQKTSLNEQIVKKIKDKIQKTKSDHEQTMQMWQTRINDLQKSVQDYHNQLRFIMESH